MMFVSALPTASLISVSSTGTEVDFACLWAETPEDDPLFMETVELVAKRSRTASNEIWQLEWSDGKTALARAFPFETGQFGERVRLEWTENGAMKQAFVSNLPVSETGQEVVLLRLDAASPEQPPGFVCLSAPLEENIQ